MKNFSIKYPENDGGMNPRIKRLRKESVETPATLTIERALIETAFYKENYGKYSIPVLRARNFYEICAKKTLYIGPDELIVGERGPKTYGMAIALLAVWFAPDEELRAFRDDALQLARNAPQEDWLPLH